MTDLEPDLDDNEPVTESLLSKVVHLSEELSLHLSSGLPLLPHIDIDARVDICNRNTCGYWQEFRCGLCKCRINRTRWLLNKAALPLAHCPLPTPLW